MYLSVLLRPEIPRDQWFGFSFAAALAVSDTVSHFLETRLAAADGPEIGLKWPNDILVGGGKIAGILLEADDNSLVIGSGINIAPLVAVPDVRFAPVSLADFLPSADQLPSPQNVADIYLERLGFWTQNLADGGFGPIRAEWLDRALFRNLRVEIDRQGAVICGLFSGVADDGGMLLLDDSGKTHHITTGDVQFMGG
jgi:BirA family biotin operon repressor/biotin-[acetyl-CoA-carboxylase] ligase